MFERNGQKLGSVLVDEAGAEPEPEEQDTSEVDSGEATEVKPSMAMSKEELVDLAEKAGLGERSDLEQFTKQDLVDELKANEGES
jgi:hypothetical protein